MVSSRPPRQGEVWWGEFEDQRRPLLVVSRTFAGSRLNRLVVAPITRTIRRIPTEVRVGREVGLPADGVASFDNLRTWPTALLTDRVGTIELAESRICAAIAAMADC